MDHHGVKGLKKYSACGAGDVATISTRKNRQGQGSSAVQGAHAAGRAKIIPDNCVSSVLMKTS
jgi:hypothetical protein